MSALEQVMDEFGIPYSERGECEDMAQEVMRLRAERDAAVRDATIVREIRARKNVVVEVSPELLNADAWSDEPLHVLLTKNTDGTHTLTFRESNELRTLRANLDALTSHMNQVHEELNGTDTVLTIEAAQLVMARLAACERVVEAACEYVCGEDANNVPLKYAVRAYRAAVSTAKENA